MSDVFPADSENIIHRATLGDVIAIDLLDAALPSGDDELLTAVAKAIEENDDKKLGAIVRRCIEDGLKRITKKH